MRTTVGPLPSAVYWRRRAVVLGAVLLGIIVLFVSCSGDDPDAPNGRGAPASQYPTPAPDSAAPETEPSFLDGVPGGNDPTLPAPDDLRPSAGAGQGEGGPTLPGSDNGQNSNVTAASDGSCADQEMSVVPSTAAATVKRTASVELTLTIKNIGTRTCARDVGAGAQELYLVQGARRYWSSDTCSTAKGQDVRQLNPGDQRVYKITWNGRQDNICAANQPAGPNPPPGQFELRARLGTLVSEPLALTIVE
jgi:hypothetical protein